MTPPGKAGSYRSVTAHITKQTALDRAGVSHPRRSRYSWEGGRVSCGKHGLSGKEAGVGEGRKATGGPGLRVGAFARANAFLRQVTRALLPPPTSHPG